MPMLITPKEPIAAQAFHFAMQDAEDIWRAADLVTDIGFTLNAKWYKDPSPSAPDDLICDITIRPLNSPANDTNSLKAKNGDWITYDGINLVVKTHAEVEAAYDLQAPKPEDAPPA